VDVRTFCFIKLRFYGVSAWKKGLKHANKGGGGSFFVILCGHILYMGLKLNLDG